ncbi:aldose epimerase family protein [Alishewanella sp. d11]|uniref:aldose epimerase family protein n=1 Tax=Alishewanella sp. d11 TaxID=3414030 RepID=UPI003BF86694
MFVSESHTRIITLSTAAGLKIEVMPFGATIKSIKIKGHEVCLTYPSLQQYLDNPFYLGSSIGRYANRIANGRFSLHNQDYYLTKGDQQHALHGGAVGFSHQLWDCVEFSETYCLLTLTSADGDAGFPGNLQVKLKIAVTELSVTLEFTAISDQDTIINLTNHSYFNLNKDKSSLNAHWLTIAADAYLPISSSGIPLGYSNAVVDTDFDFSQPKELTRCFDSVDPQFLTAGGYDHFYIFAPNRDLKQAVAQLVSTESGLGVRLFTTQPGLQFYSGNFLGTPFIARSGLCLEAQHWPDAPNQHTFPSAVITAHETYERTIQYEFFEL